MESSEINKLFNNCTKINDCISGLEKSDNLFLKNQVGSSASLYISNLVNNIEKTHLIILQDKEQAAYFHNDLSLFAKPKVYFFPTSYKRS